MPHSWHTFVLTFRKISANGDSPDIEATTFPLANLNLFTTFC
jgi:hypothetical protein